MMVVDDGGDDDGDNDMTLAGATEGGGWMKWMD